MAGVLIVVFILLIASWLWAVWKGVDKAEKWAAFFQAFATIGGITAAVYLYTVERRSEPHADVSQTVQAVAMTDGNVAIEAYITVKNLGTQLLSIDHIYSRVQIFDLDALGASHLLALTGEAYQNAVLLEGGTQKAAFEGTELTWKQLRFHDRDVDHRIEPGESDLITATFVLPCPAVRFVRIASDVAKPENPGWRAMLSKSTARNHEQKHDMLWKSRTIVDLEPVCGKL